MPLTIKRTNTVVAPAYSVLFNSTSYLSTPVNAVFNPGNTGAWTMECWFYPLDTTSGRVVLLGNGGAWGHALQITWGTTTTSKFTFQQQNGSAGVVWTGVSASSYALNTWYHLAVSKDGSNNIKCFIDGVEETAISQTNITSTVATNNKLLVNSQYSNLGTGDGTNGYTSNVRWIKGTALYTSSFTPSTTPLTAIANTALLTCQSATIIDNSSNNFTITNNNTATVSSITPFAAASPTNNFQFARRTSTPVGKSVQFNGSNQYLTVGSAANWAFLSNGSSWTNECWFNVPSASLSNQYAIISTNAESANVGTSIYLNNTKAGDVRAVVYKAVSGQTALSVTTNSSSFTPNAWNHVAVVYNSATSVGTIYVNGTAIASASGSAFSQNNPTYTLAIGRYQAATPASYLSGYISNLRVVNGTAVYTSNFTPSTAPLTAIANTALLTCNADTIFDSSTNNFAITNNNTATVSSISPFVASSGGMSLKKVFADPVISYMVATGGDLVTTSGSYKIHQFTTVGTSSFTISSIGNTTGVEYLIVGGGGAGGSNNNCGGGGAGGLIYNTASLSVGTYAVTVGQSGSVASGVSNGNNGGNSTFNGLVALGGGGGGGTLAGSNGGSGGGNGGGGFGGTNSGGGAGLQPTSSYGGFGNKGGFSAGASSYPGGGGGGAGAAGGNGSGATGGNGGIGKAYAFAGALTYYAGGGGGSLNPGTAGTGGLGGGGNGVSSNGVGANATGYGSGGGGGLNASGGAGSPGIILIKYRYTA
jgi:hypothetical protein